MKSYTVVSVLLKNLLNDVIDAIDHYSQVEQLFFRLNQNVTSDIVY